MEYVLNITMCTYFFCQNGAADRNKSGITTGDLSAVFLVGDSINCVVKNEDIKKPKFNFNLSREKIPSEMESEPSYQTEKGVVIRRYGTTTRYIQEVLT